MFHLFPMNNTRFFVPILSALAKTKTTHTDHRNARVERWEFFFLAACCRRLPDCSREFNFPDLDNIPEWIDDVSERCARHGHFLSLSALLFCFHYLLSAPFCFLSSFLSRFVCFFLAPFSSVNALPTILFSLSFFLLSRFLLSKTRETGQSDRDRR